MNRLLIDIYLFSYWSLLKKKLQKIKIYHMTRLSIYNYLFHSLACFLVYYLWIKKYANFSRS